jgi:hypothetical protein
MLSFGILKPNPVKQFIVTVIDSNNFDIVNKCILDINKKEDAYLMFCITKLDHNSIIEIDRVKYQVKGFSLDEDCAEIYI